MPARPRPHRPRRQRGVVMIFALIAMVVMLIGAAALVRSATATIANTANLGFKRDLTNQAERAASTALALLKTGALASATAREGNSQANNYSAAMITDVNAQGLPNALLDDTKFAAIASAANDISVTSQAVTIRYLIDRLCTVTGAVDESRCQMSDNGQSNSCSSNACYDTTDAVPRQPVYRLSIRVTGPRRTQAFFQTTLTL